MAKTVAKKTVAAKKSATKKSVAKSAPKREKNTERHAFGSCVPMGACPGHD